MISSPIASLRSSPDLRAVHASLPSTLAAITQQGRQEVPVSEIAVSNRLWAWLPSVQRERLMQQAQWVTLNRGTTLMHAAQACKHVYLPCSATVGLILRTTSGKSCQVGLIGNDGMVGVNGIVGGQRIPCEAVVRTPGTARRIAGNALADEFAPGSTGAELFTRYSHVLMVQMAYAAVCCRHHSVEQRTCRLLLQTFDATGGDVFLTHEVMAECLGVRRESVSEVASRLHQAGEISYSRGRIAINKLAALHARSCECYAAVKSELASMLDEYSFERAQGPVRAPRSSHAWMGAN